MFRYSLGSRCVDLTSRIEMRQPGVTAARGRYSDIYRGSLDNKNEVAIKCLRPDVINETGGQDHEVRNTGTGSE